MSETCIGSKLMSECAAVALLSGPYLLKMHDVIPVSGNVIVLEVLLLKQKHHRRPSSSLSSYG
jgi:hypothetical protein